MDKTTRKFVPKSARLMDQVREVLRFHHYAYNTEKSYISWILKYIRFHNKKHPKDMGKQEIEAFLSHLAINRNVSASTQNQAFNALLFLYREVLNLDMELDIRAARARTSPAPACCPESPAGRSYNQRFTGRSQADGTAYVRLRPALARGHQVESARR